MEKDQRWGLCNVNIQEQPGVLQSCSPVSDAGPYPSLDNLNDGQADISLVHEINPHLAFLSFVIP